MKVLIVFVDTNIFLHYVSVDQIAWEQIISQELSGSRITVLMVVPATIRELNKHKDSHPIRRIRDRAAAALRRLDEYSNRNLPTKLREGVLLDFVPHEPRVDFEALHLSTLIGDDLLIANILEYHSEKPDDPVLLVTADVGLKLKARHHQIKTRTLPDDWKLPDEPDPSEKRLRELEIQVRELENTSPKLVLEFEDRKQHSTFGLSPGRPLRNEVEIDQQIVELQRNLPKFSQTTVSVSDHTYDFMRHIDRADIDAYNTKLSNYYEGYRSYLKNLDNFEDAKLRTIELQIQICNGGSTPAEDIDVWMHFPDGFNLFDEEHLPPAPKPPSPPAKPLTALEKMSQGISGSALASMLKVPRLDIPTIEPTSNVSKPKIRRSQSHELDIHIQRLKHGFFQKLGPLYVAFESFVSAKSFGIDYAIHAANAPSVARGHLDVVIQKQYE